MDSRFCRVVETLPGLVWTSLPDGQVDFLNQRWRDYTGLSAGETTGWDWQTTVHPDDLPHLRERWDACLASGVPGEAQARLRRFDGAYRWFLLRASPSADAAGDIAGWCGVAVDIEDRVRAETLLAGERRVLEMAASGQPMAAMLDALCRLVEATIGGCRCGVVLLDARGARLEHGAAPGLPEHFVTTIIGRPVTADADPCAMAARLDQQVIVADLASETRWPADGWRQTGLELGLRACWATPIASIHRKVLGVLAIHHHAPRTPAASDQALMEQFTRIAGIAIERAQNDAALKRSEAFLAETRRLSSTGGFSKRVATGEITWSEEIYRIFELDPAVPVTLDLILTRVHPEDLPSFQDMLERQRRGSDYEHDYRLLMPDRSVKYLHVVAHANRGEDGELEYIAAVQDVTQRRLAEDALAKARSELTRVARVSSLGALTASIAHEVNQPLSGIITNAGTCLRMLAADPPNVDGARETARRTIRDGNRASDVITRLRALFGKKDATIEPVDLNEATSEVIALSLSELQRNRVILRQELADDLPRVIGDRVQLQQVVLNLLRNAMDSMSGVADRPRLLVVRTEPDQDDHVRLTVRDAGVGFDPQDAERLFDAFYTTKSGGMGIGLSVSRSIIERHHGRLWAVANDGPGAAFAFSIPERPGGISHALAGGVTDAPDLGAIWTSAVTDARNVIGTT